MAKDGKCCDNMFHDWFYILLLLLIGVMLLGVNLGFLSGNIYAYWPVILIVVALKEMLERR